MSRNTRLSLCLFALAAFPALGATWNPDPAVGNVDQHRRLYNIAMHYDEVNFDPDAHLVGVHSHHPPDKKQHAIRESAYYAYGLLLGGDPSDRARAQELLKRVVASQDTRPNSPSRGVFLWIAEDKWETLKNPDVNSAAFVGLALADVIDLDRRHPSLDPDVRHDVESAAKLAVEAVIRRDVDPGYTNIALLSIAVAAAGQKLWAMPGAGAFAEKKLDTVLGLAGDGYVYEYLSPTYTGVDFFGAYSARKFAFSGAFEKKSNAMIDSLWKQVAAAYHAPTCQLAGPFGRAYGDNMLSYAACLKYWLYLALDGAYPFPDDEIDRGGDQGGLTIMVDLPIPPRPEFKVPPVPWREFTAVGPDDGVHPPRHLVQYRDGNFILGTVAFQDEWKQKRNLVAYWRNDGPPPDGFKVGFCIDESNESLPNGFPYAQVHFYSKQVKDAALVVTTTSTTVPGVGGLSLVFDDGAVVPDTKSAAPLRIQDGTMTAYLYPVSTGTVGFDNVPDPAHHVTRIVKSWSTADVAGPFHVLSYLVVFRPTGQPAPEVSGLALKTDATGISAHGNVDGHELSVLVKNG